MATAETRVQYLAPAGAGELVQVGTWLVGGDRLRMRRAFQVIRPSDGQVLLRAEQDYICISIKTGKPRRMPGFMLDAHQRGAKTACPD